VPAVEAGPNNEPPMSPQKWVVRLDGDNSVQQDVPRAHVRTPQRVAGGGVIFIDEAYDLDPRGNRRGRAIVDTLMEIAEAQRDHVSVILAGYKDRMRDELISANDGWKRRLVMLEFADFSERDLLQKWRELCRDARVQCDGIVGTVVSRRLAKQSGSRGFGNAGAVRQMFDAALGCASSRAMQAGSSNASSASNATTAIVVEDVIGPRPTPDKIPALKAALTELDGMVGLAAVKASVRTLVDLLCRNYDLELAGDEPDELMLHRLFVGSPGTVDAVAWFLCLMRSLVFNYMPHAYVSLFVPRVVQSRHWQNRGRSIVRSHSQVVASVERRFVCRDQAGRLYR
jgi:hypothetical protein